MVGGKEAAVKICRAAATYLNSDNVRLLEQMGSRTVVSGSFAD